MQKLFIKISDTQKLFAGNSRIVAFASNSMLFIFCLRYRVNFFNFFLDIKFNKDTNVKYGEWQLKIAVFYLCIFFFSDREILQKLLLGVQKINLKSHYHMQTYKS